MRSINQKLRIVVFISLAASFLVSTSYWMWTDFTARKTASLRHQRDVAKFIAATIDSHLRCVEREMFCAFHGHEYARLSLDRRRGILAELFSRYDNMVSLVYLDENNKELIRLAAGDQTSAVVPNTCGEVDELVSQRLKESRFCLRKSSEDLLVSIITPSVHLFGDWRGGTLITDLSLHNMLTGLYESEKEPDLTLYVVDEQGRMITHGFSGNINTDKMVSENPHEWSGEVRLDNGEKALRAVIAKRYNGLSLYFIVQKKLDVLLGQTIDEVIKNLPAQLLIAGLIFFGVMAVVSNIISPFRKLRDKALMLHDGESWRDDLPVSASGEAGELAVIINDLAKALHQSNSSLEHESSERKNNEKQVTMYRAFFQASLNFYDDLIVYKDEKGRHLGCNNAAEKFFKSMREEMPAYRAGAVLGEMDQQVLQAGVEQTFEKEVQVSAGRPLVLSTTTLPVRVQGGEIIGLLGVSRDISVRREMESELSKLRARIEYLERKGVVGIFTAGMAHDFNNLLGAVLGYTEMVMDEQPVESQARKDLQNVMDAGMKAKDLVRQILAFARGGGDEAILMSPLSLVKESVKEYGKELPEPIELTADIDPDCPMIVIDPSQLHRLLSDLWSRAQLVIGVQEGLLRVAMCGERLTAENLIAKVGVKEGEYVKLEVCCKPLAMNGKLLHHYVEPFQSVKGGGRESAEEIVNNAGGVFFQDSGGSGEVCFRAYFPAVNEDGEPI